MKYIDAEKLKAEIERRKEEYKEDGYMSDYRGRITYYKDEIYDDLLSFIDSLQQEATEVDLEEEIIAWWEKHYSKEDYEFEKMNGHYIENTTLLDIARHFYELGLNARKED